MFFLIVDLFVSQDNSGKNKSVAQSNNDLDKYYFFLDYEKLRAYSLSLIAFNYVIP